VVEMDQTVLTAMLRRFEIFRIESRRDEPA
jgi:hypothetical protein